MSGSLVDFKHVFRHFHRHLIKQQALLDFQLESQSNVGMTINFSIADNQTFVKFHAISGRKGLKKAFLLLTPIISSAYIVDK